MIRAASSRAEYRFKRRSACKLVMRAQHLNDNDRALIEAIYEHGLTACEVARLLGEPPRAVQRRVVCIVRHLRSPIFRMVAEWIDLLPRDLQAIARYRVLERRSQRETARLIGRSDHYVRTRTLQIRALVATDGMAPHNGKGKL